MVYLCIKSNLDMTHQKPQKMTLIDYWNNNPMAYVGFALLIPLLSFSIYQNVWQTTTLFGAALITLIGGSIANVKQANKRNK